MKNYLKPIALLVLILCPLIMKAQAERILNFKSHLQVHANAGITVTEEITVYSAAIDIKRGIYRSLPVNYTDHLNNQYKARYEIISVLRDGQPEPYHIEYDGDYKVVYIGEENVYLNPGIYTYTITYESPRQIRFFDGYDELYWNVTGNMWGFPIDSAEVSVTMPSAVNIISQTAYTGYFGDQGQDYVISKGANGDFVCRTTRPLFATEGLSFAFSFPKGVILEPTQSELFGYFISDNIGTIISIVILLLTALYFIFAWFKVGRDPEKGAIPVLYFPPEKMTAGALRFVHKMGFDNKAFTAAIIQMAVKKFLVIENEKGEYTLRKIDQSESSLSPEEKAIASTLFRSGSVVKLKNTNHETISKAISGFKYQLKSTYQKTNFFTNIRWFIPGLIATLVAILIMLVGLFRGGPVGLPTILFLIFGGGSILFFYAMITTWKKVKTNKKLIASAILLTVISVPLLIVFTIVSLAYITEIAYLPMLFLMAGIGNAVLFHYLLKAPTIEGRRLMDQIDGFKEYLAVAEKDELNLQNPPEKTPQLFESYLPYAVALGVENAWGSRFDDLIKKALEDHSYNPSWYIGANIATFSAVSFASGLSGSFSSAVSSSSVSPSSSGSGGGGFSGGGGGGGGGGGW